MRSKKRTTAQSSFAAFPAAVERAYRRIRRDIVRTPLRHSPGLSRASGARVHVKWECDQTTGSFKLRGALNRVRMLSAGERRRGIVSASTGNHGLAVNHAARLEEIGLKLFLPVNASPAKIAKLRRAGADLHFHETDCELTERRARREAESTGRVFVSPYNDLAVICGQGTIGIEIREDLPEVEAVIVPVGGGGLVSGIAGYLKSRNPSVKVFGVEPAASAFMKASLEAGRLVAIAEKPTMADAVAGGIEPGSVTFPFCRRFVDAVLTVSEADLKSAMRTMAATERRVVEPAGALACAALFRHRRLFRDRVVVLVVSGKNIAPKTFRELARR